ncbi:hypothetical protein [Herbiconiux sp. L3-i23]|uniref:hypothetical protein n=1 Tax=Herbiconiux sp. L3-i23 TaxID=2905871 RepID=UPI00206B4CB5|nr:hypothetical protein [Herbiconiux sp. L3-i23]BDI23543.1 hypothetical protein L3i23_23190 [Herbiconiux sp. L3-i23]
MSEGFPVGVPVRVMSDAEQAAYWKDKARKHERRWRLLMKKLRRSVDAMDDLLGELEQVEDAALGAEKE